MEEAGSELNVERLNEDATKDKDEGNTLIVTTAPSSDNSAIPLEGSMVICLQSNEQGELSVPLLTTPGNTSTDQQLVALVQNFDGVSADATPTIAPSEAIQTLGEKEITSEVVASLLSSVVQTPSSDDPSLSQQRSGAFQTEDGHILYLTYTVADESVLEQQEDSSVPQRMVLHMTEDGSTFMLPAESLSISELDVSGTTNEGGILQQLTVNNVYPTVEDCDLPGDILPTYLCQDSLARNGNKEEQNENEKLASDSPFRRRTEQVLGNELDIEKKLEVLDAMLTPVPERSRKRKLENPNATDKDALYICDLCETTFTRAAQYYGHLHSHSGEWKWECTTCPGKVVFSSQSLLRRHEKECHLNLRPHICNMCNARFDRVSQLSYHQRRIHAGERTHVCQICSKAFFKRSDLKTHLNIHLGINKCICETCGKKFNHVSNLIRHTRMHSGIKPYPCTICGRRFSQLNALHQHKTSHQTQKNVACTMCPRMFKSHMVMRKHVRQFHRDKLATFGKDISTVLKRKESTQSRRFYCKVCGENFEFGALLKQHERIHEKENSFHCSCCGQDYSSMETLKYHSCLMPEERVQKEPDESTLNNQLARFFREHGDILSSNNSDSNSRGIMGEIIVYVTQEGQDEPTQVHIGSIGSVVNSTAKQISSESTPESMPAEGDLIEKSPTANNFQVDKKVTPIILLENTTANPIVDSEPHLETHIRLDFCNPEPIAANNANDSSVVKETQLSSFFREHKSLENESSYHFARGVESLTEPNQESDCNNGATENIKVKAEPETVPKPPEHNPVINDKDITFASNPPVETNTETLKSSNTKKPARVYKCPECPKVFVKKSNYRQHLGIHFIDQQRYCCQKCGQSFAWKSTLNKHMLTHSEGPLPRYRCDLCLKEYGSATQVQEHIKRDHFKQRPHACLVCSKTFYKKYDLKIHFRTHTKERPYICGTCGKSFYHLSHIIRHERIHSGQRPYSCPDCGRTFNQSSSLKSHRQRHTQCTEKALLEGLALPQQGEELPQQEFETVLLYPTNNL